MTKASADEVLNSGLRLRMSLPISPELPPPQPRHRLRSQSCAPSQRRNTRAQCSVASPLSGINQAYLEPRPSSHRRYFSGDSKAALHSVAKFYNCANVIALDADRRVSSWAGFTL
ncbi:hypothetical protein AB1N83_012716 [Pleurotus pulmonarius]